MSYQALARKWRPQVFSSIVGQKHVLAVLMNSLSSGKIHHCYLFSGTHGVGKTTIARILAKGLNCVDGITATPCCQCDNCCEIEQGRFVDLIEIDAASRTKVEDIRELLNSVQYGPARGRLKVYLIDEIHMLSRYSFNALLKTLEEPPLHVKFLLATTDAQKLPATILSRCLQLHLKLLNVEQIHSKLSMVLQKEGIAIAPMALQLLARAAAGSMRDALSLTDQAIAMGGKEEISLDAVNVMLGTLNIQYPLALVETLANADGHAMLTQLAQCSELGIDWENLLLEMLSILHCLATSQLFPSQLDNEEYLGIAPRLRRLASRVSPSKLQLYYQILLIGHKELPFAPHPRIGVEMILLRALARHPASSDAPKRPISLGKKTANPGTTEISDVSFCIEKPVVNSIERYVEPLSIDPICPSRSFRSAPIAKSEVKPITLLNSEPSFVGCNRNSPPLNTFVDTYRKQFCLVRKKERADIYQSGNTSSAIENAALCFGETISTFLSNSRSRNMDTNHLVKLTTRARTLTAKYSKSKKISTSSDKPSLLEEKRRNNVRSTAAGRIFIKTHPGDGCSNDKNEEKENVVLTNGGVTPKNIKPLTLPPPYGTRIPDKITQILEARASLKLHQEVQKIKKNEQRTFLCRRPNISELQQKLDYNIQAHQPASNRLPSTTKNLDFESSFWLTTQASEVEIESSLKTQKALNATSRHGQFKKLGPYMMGRTLECNLSVIQVEKLLALEVAKNLSSNARKDGWVSNSIFRQSHTLPDHSNAVIEKDARCSVLHAHLGINTIASTAKENDNNSKVKISLECRQEMYEKKLLMAREVIMNDAHIHMLQRFFDAELDEDSIRPV